MRAIFLRGFDICLLYQERNRTPASLCEKWGRFRVNIFRENLQRNAFLVKDLQKLQPNALPNLIDKEPLLSLSYPQKPNPDKPEKIATKAPRHKEELFIII